MLTKTSILLLQHFIKELLQIHLSVIISGILSFSRTAGWFLILLGFAKNDVGLCICSGWTLWLGTPCFALSH